MSRAQERVEELKAELFFFVVAGEEDLAVLVEAVDQTFDGVGGVPHQGSAYRAPGQCQPTDPVSVIGLERLLQVILLQGPEQAPLQRQEQVLLRDLVQA